MTITQARAAVAASFLLYLSMGIPDGVLGTIWPNLRDHFGRGDGSFGAVVFASALGYGTGGLASGRLGAAFGVSRVLPVAASLVVAALALIAAAPTFGVVLVGFGLVGTGWGVGDATVNAWMALTQGHREMGLLHASYGVGTFIGPLLATALVAGGPSWRSPYVVCLMVAAAASAVLVSVRAGFDHGPTAGAASQPGPDRGTGLLMAAMIAWFAVYVGVEVAVGQWAFTLLSEGRGRSDVAAGAWTAAYWGGLTAGRFALAAVGPRLAPEATMTATTGASLVAAAVLWADDGVLGATMLPALGLLFAPMFPVMIGRTPAYLGGERATRAVGYQIGATPLGFTAVPAVIGLLADRHGIGVAPPVILAGLVILGSLWWTIAVTAARPLVSRAAS